MKKILYMLLLFVSISAFGYSPAHAIGAVVLENDHCVLDGDASALGVSLMTYEVTKEVTPQGTIQLVCVFNIPEGAEPDQAERTEEISCRIPTSNGSVYTTDTLLVITPGGRAVLTCKYTP